MSTKRTPNPRRGSAPVNDVKGIIEELLEGAAEPKPKLKPPWPVAHVLGEVAAEASPWSSSERLVAIMVAKHMRWEADHATCFLKVATIARLSALSVRSVQYALGRLCSATGPAIFTRRPRRVGRYGRGCDVFMLVVSPAALAAYRETRRS